MLRFTRSEIGERSPHQNWRNRDAGPWVSSRMGQPPGVAYSRMSAIGRSSRHSIAHGGMTAIGASTSLPRTRAKVRSSFALQTSANAMAF